MGAHDDTSQRPRRPETLQRYWLERIRPYLDFANLLDASRDLPPPYMLPDQGFTGPLFDELFPKAKARFPVPDEVRSKIKSGKGRIVGWLPDRDAPDGGWRIDILFLYETFYAVRNTAQQVLDAVREPVGGGRPPSILIPPTARILKVREDGTIQQSGGVLEGFLKLLERVEATRISRCPICGKFFYAVRANKGACDEHLAYARVQRGRDPELRRQYEQNRQINRLVREGMSLAQAKEEVSRKRENRRSRK